MRNFWLQLTAKDLEFLRDIFHESKDYNRGWAEHIREVMALEAKLSEQTGGVYEPDTTYDIK